jgi:hypothetical protein
MMTLTSDALKICARVLGTCEPNCTGRPVSLFFMFEAHDSQGTALCVVARSPTTREAGFGAV